MGCCDTTEKETVHEGGVKIRSCTDVPWLIMYILLWFLMILIAGFALVYGNPRRLVNGYDSFGNTCGSSCNERIGNFSLSGLDMTSKKYLFFMDVKNIRQSLQICVEKCPDRDLHTLNDIRNFYEETGSSLCRYDYNLSKDSKSDSLHGMDEELTVTSPLGPCPPLQVYKSEPVLNRCVPVLAGSLSKQIVGNVFAMLNSWDFVEQVLGDLYATWHYILASTFFALFLSLVMVSLFYLIASIVAYVIMILVCVSSLVGTLALWWTFLDIKKELDNTPESELLEESVQNERAFLIYALITTVFTLIILLLVHSMRRRVDFLSALFKEVADCLSEVPSLYLLPVICFIELLAFYIFWVIVVVCLATANYPGTKLIFPYSSSPVEILSTVPSHHVNSTYGSYEYNLLSNVSVSHHKTFTFVIYADATWVRYMWWVYLISLVWTSEFTLSCQQMVISGAVAHWYFRGWKKTIKSPVFTSFRHLLCYHLGSAALGSLLITIFKLPRLILTYTYYKLKKYEEFSTCARCGLKYCICCFWCLERFIRYINHNAYTIVALQGMNFCPAAGRAFHILATNALQLATINSVGDFVLFLGKVIVTAITGSVGLLLLKNNTDLHFYSAPTLVICIFAYFIAHSVISLYDIVIDTLFLCICEDRNMNSDGNCWRQNIFANIRSNNSNVSTNQNAPELSPMNT
ncbi:choline transporter-like protein 1 [Lycorma delicatula]|uniref:choline transporter-like protein 1 n=1 Tax=Lycorma delicatula TaxID=130591 RepID=UPI003F50E3AF